MSILKKPYEISVWDDVWNPTLLKFEEKRLGIIGSNDMSYQGRAIEPNLVRNVNGTKKFSFKMYRYFVDNETGEKVENPFINWLVSERKVKLHYKGKWYDFIVKNIVENSSNYLYTYQLEDALVLELSKNGFGVTLDTKLMNNMGTAEELAEYVLAETDWNVKAEAFVEQVEDNLVYVKMPTDLSALNIYRIRDQRFDKSNPNLYKGTSDFSGEAWYNLSSWTKTNFTDDYGNIVYERNAAYSALNQIIPVIIGKTYTYSALISSNNDNVTCVCSAYIYPQPSKEGSIKSLDGGDVIANKIPELLTRTYTIPEIGEYKKGMQVYATFSCSRQDTANGTLRISSIKVEEDDKATGWAPAIEDNLSNGAREVLLTEYNSIKKSDLSGKEVLAFYTSCTSKPNRFQFIYIPEGYYKEDNNGKRTPSVPTDKSQIINVKDCQYYCEIDKPELDGEYVKNESFPQFYLPKDFTVFDKGQSGISNSHDTTISVWYRGKRYGFAQSAKYIPLLDRYCNEYTKETTKYYGFVDNDYASPALSQNMVTNTEFKGTTGWVGTYSGSTLNAKADFGAEVEAVYGRFNNNNFSSVVDELSNGTYDSDNDYTAYLKVVFPANGSADKAILLNTGFYDNRSLIKQVNYDKEWYFNADIINGSGTAVNAFTTFDFVLREVSFNPASGSYILGNIWAECTSKTIDEETVHLLKFNSKEKTSGQYADVKISEKDFKKKEIKLVITPKTNSEKTTYYIKDMQLFELILNDESKIIKPGDIDIEGVVKTTYRFFPADYVQEIEGSFISVVTDAENISYENFDKTEVDYSIYKPKYNAGARKVRSVDVKESNYFNILQKIAETFEIWLDLEIERDALGGIISKTAKFKNYVGKDNHAAFRYGVNLKDIQRTYESKNIVTKLIVKQNSNEHAQNGFCTIARAGSNQTGENYIYDFRYFHDRDMLDATDYVSSLYYSQNPLQPEGSTTVEQGPDLGEGHESEQYNLQNYFNRVKNLNTKIENINETIIPLTTELTKYKAELEVQSGLRDAASEGINQVREDFAVLTGLTPETIAEDDFSKIECTIPSADAEATTNSGAGVNKINSASWAQNATITATQVGAANSTKWKFNITLADSPTILSQKNDATSVNNEGGYCLVPYSANENQFKTVWDSSNKKLTTTGHNGLKVYHKYQQNKIYKLEYDLKCESGTLSTIGGHNIPFSNCTLSYCVDGTGLWSTPSTNASVAISTEDSQKTIHIKQIGTFNCPSLQSAAYYGTNCFYIQPNKPQGSETLSTVTCTISNVKLSEYGINTSSKERTIYIQPTFTLTPVQGNPVIKTPKIPCTIPAYSNTGTKEYSLTIVDTTASSISSLLTEYATYLSQYNESKLKAGYKNADGNEVKGSLQTTVETKEEEIENKQQEINTLLEYKKALNQLFYSRYSRFIQEGTWMDEKYIDDDKYYADAQSVMYNSCYPQVAYNINVIALDALPEYEGFDFELGDKTYAIDPEFFGEDYQEEVIVNEMSTSLDDPTKDQIKVQNFKNQFQDLFQKITATVQQAQYSTGSYEKAVALAEANAVVKSEFLNEALSSANSRLSAAGQTTVVQGADGITLTDEATKDQMRLIGGAILMSVEDENGQRKWKTGLTPDGISASLVTAGTINTGNISIMNGKDATFMWNAYGLSAFDVDWTNGEITGTPKKNKFVRFDKYGIYGINDNGADSVDGTTWKPTSNDEIDNKATFALTWEGLKVTGNDGGVARIGKQNGYIMVVENTDGKPTFRISNDGSVQMAGSLMIGGTLDDENGTSIENFVGDAVNNIEIGGKNLVLKSDQINESSTYLIATYDLSEDWSTNTEYCITIKGEVNSGQVFGIWANGSWTNVAYLTLDTVTGLHKAVFTTPNEITTNENAKTLRVYNYKDSGASYAKIYQIKLEKGNKATDWTPAPEDQVLAISDNENFSWKFLPNSGFYMYNGKASVSEPDEVFKIYKNEAEGKQRYEAWMRGHIIAESGSISGYTIDNNVLYSGDSNTANTYAGLSKYGAGPAFWAGANSQSITDQNNANFLVYHDGRAICKNIEATGGKIGDFTLSNGTLTNSYGTSGKFVINSSITSESMPVLIAGQEVSREGNMSGVAYFFWDDIADVGVRDVEIKLPQNSTYMKTTCYPSTAKSGPVTATYNATKHSVKLEYDAQMGESVSVSYNIVYSYLGGSLQITSDGTLIAEEGRFGNLVIDSIPFQWPKGWVQENSGKYPEVKTLYLSGTKEIKDGSDFYFSNFYIRSDGIVGQFVNNQWAGMRGNKLVSGLSDKPHEIEIAYNNIMFKNNNGTVGQIYLDSSSTTDLTISTTGTVKIKCGDNTVDILQLYKDVKILLNGSSSSGGTIR